MAANVESLGALERRVSMRVPVEEIERQVDERLKKLARDVRMPDSARQGAAQAGGADLRPQVRSEVLGDAVQKAFTEVVKEANLRVAGYPRIEKKAAADDKALEFSATFEVYPEVKLGDLSAASIERPKSRSTMRRSTGRSRSCASSARASCRRAVRRATAIA